MGAILAFAVSASGLLRRQAVTPASRRLLFAAEFFET
jgi:hypothetical protein